MGKVSSFALPPTPLHIDGVTFPAFVTPPEYSSSSKSPLFLAGAGVRGLEIGGKFVKFTAIGIYLEESSLGALAEKWTAKPADELAASPDFYADIINGVLRLLYGINEVEQLGNGAHQSFFLKDLKSLTQFYSVSTTVQAFTDTVIWNWTSSGTFSTSSAYHLMHNRGITWPHRNRVWKAKIPPKVRVFLWVLLQNKLLTRAMLRRRGCTAPEGCVLCGEARMEETAKHIFWSCSYAGQFWNELFAALTLGPIPNRVTNHIRLGQAEPPNLMADQSRIWKTAWTSGLWALWRERNNRIFTQKCKRTTVLLQETLGEVRQWVSHC